GGIGAEQRRARYVAFTQADRSARRHYGGTVLGLAITARLVELMGGRIWVDSVVGQGSTFHMTIRFGLQHSLQQEERSIPSLQHTLPAYRQRSRILLAEDNPANQKILIRLLEKYGYTVAVVSNGRQALTALEQEHFDLALMDVQMPEIDGLTVVTTIRERDQQTG